MDKNENGSWNEPKTPFSLEGHWQPWYDDRRDYNTNAPTYYDYLANINSIPASEVELINRVAKRNIKVADSQTVEMVKQGDWISEGDKGDNGQSSWHYVVNLTSNVKIDDIRKPQIKFNDKYYKCDNSIRILNYGIYVPEYLPIMNDMQADINMVGKNHTDYVTYNDQQIFHLKQQLEDMQNKYTEMTTKYAILETAVQKFVDNLNYNGNATTNNIETFELVDGIACGNINVWGGTAGGGSLIRTHNGVHENDIAIGHI